MRTCIRSQTKMAMMWLSSNNTDVSMNRVFGKKPASDCRKINSSCDADPTHTTPYHTHSDTLSHNTPHRTALFHTTPWHLLHHTPAQHTTPPTTIHHTTCHTTPPATPHHLPHHTTCHTHHLPHATKPHYTTPPLTYFLTFPRLALVSDFMSSVTHFAWNYLLRIARYKFPKF